MDRKTEFLLRAELTDYTVRGLVDAFEKTLEEESPRIPRGFIMDELNSRDSKAYVKWLDSFPLHFGKPKSPRVFFIR